jgi:hypothetical protein
MRVTFIGKDAAGILAAALVVMVGAFGAATARATPRDKNDRVAANQAFDRYIQLTEARMSHELAPGGAFLRVDALGAADRDVAYASLRRGELRIEPVVTLEDGKAIACPGCMIHHWVGAVFIPGATLEQVLRLMQDYDHQAEIYAPDVVGAKTVSRSGEEFHVFMRFRRTKVLTVVLDTEHDVRYERLDAMRAASRSVSTRVQEVENAGGAKERDLPEGEDNGYLWRMNSYWRFLERDGGVYVQSESVSLTRDIPVGLAWIAGPFVESVPRESLSFMLTATRKYFLGAKSDGPSAGERRH